MAKSLYYCAPLQTKRWARQGQHYGTLVTREPQCLENHHTAAELLTGLSLLGLPKAVWKRWAIQVTANQAGAFTPAPVHMTLSSVVVAVKFANSSASLRAAIKFNWATKMVIRASQFDYCKGSVDWCELWRNRHINNCQLKGNNIKSTQT